MKTSKSKLWLTDKNQPLVRYSPSRNKHRVEVLTQDPVLAALPDLIEALNQAYEAWQSETNGHALFPPPKD